ncbi:MAG: tRNA (guanosine(46)-N7)-methyltransferase TrmB [Acholeplasmataceae bacterium]|nr:tRNA (guanosine(46)-N7)-methyltransferase TrmB [Acholeplasmataceae bacterium]
MRQKKLKYVSPELLESQGVLMNIEPLELKSVPTFLEVGSGKGLFITSLAKDNPECVYIAMEINMNICYRILEKKLALNLDNLIIILGDAENLLSYLKPQSIDGLYLNFSDPWPKKKHHKRRLTAPTFMEKYVQILKDQAFIQFRTDQIDLFDSSIEYMHQYIKMEKIDYHLEPSKYMTEYEIRKREIGPIYQLIGKVEHHAKENI